MTVPEELRFTKDHEWIRLDGDIATIGITDYAQGELGDIVYLELPESGVEVTIEESFGTIEAVKAVSDLFAPLSGKIIEINENLDNNPEIINSDPYGDGWMVKIKLSDPNEIDGLLNSSQYSKLI